MTLNVRRDREKENLDSFLTRLIAEVDGVDEEKITVEYIRKQREELIYPDTRHDIGSGYGGYEGAGLTFFTRKEFDDIEDSVDSKIKRIT